MCSNDYDQEEDEQHDPNSEPVPPLPQYQSAFTQAETVASATIHKVSMHVADEPDQDSESMYMHERLVAIERPAYPSPVRVAICGSSGIGKSTMINAIFGFPLCPTVSVHSLVLSHCSQGSQSDNDVGTYVPMELFHAPSGQSTRFMFYVDLFPLHDCIQFVRWAIKDCYNSYNDQEKNDADDGHADRGGPALKVLLALFKEKDEFTDEEAALDYFGTLNSPHDPLAVSKMLLWTHEIHKKLSAKIGKAPMTATTAEELAELIEPYIQTAESPMIQLDDHDTLECCVWPFVRLAR